MNNLEEGKLLQLDWDKLTQVAQTGQKVVPVVVQEIDSRDVLIVAYANEEALQNTLASGKVTFWSTSRNELWVKGKTSGDELDIVEVRVNCEQNSLLYLVKMKSTGSCHTKAPNGKSRKACYYRKVNTDLSLTFVDE